MIFRYTFGRKLERASYPVARNVYYILCPSYRSFENDIVEAMQTEKRRTSLVQSIAAFLLKRLLFLPRNSIMTNRTFRLHYILHGFPLLGPY